MKGAAHSIHADDMQAIGYVRVSTDRQAEQGVSLDAQEGGSMRVGDHGLG